MKNDNVCVASPENYRRVKSNVCGFLCKSKMEDREVFGDSEVKRIGKMMELRSERGLAEKNGMERRCVLVCGG